MQRRVIDLPPPVLALTRMCGDSASRSTETTRPPEPIPMTGAHSGALAHLGVLEEGLRRGLEGLLHQHGRLASGRVPGEAHALQGEFLGDEISDDVAGEPQVYRQVDAYLRVVVAEVLRDVQVAGRSGLLRGAERPVGASCSGTTHSRISSRRSWVSSPYAMPPTARAQAPPIPPASRVARACCRPSQRAWTVCAVASGSRLSR